MPPPVGLRPNRRCGRAGDSLLSIDHGQRLGIIAGSGVGKSVLLSMMTRFTEADVVVVGLVNERGREVGHSSKRR